MPMPRTKTVGAKVTEEEYEQLEAQAGARGMSLSEWCREVLLAEKKRTTTPSAETILAEILGLRMLYLNTIQIIGAGRELTTEELRKLIEKVDGEKPRRVAEIVEAQAARKKKAPRAETSGNGAGCPRLSNSSLCPSK